MFASISENPYTVYKIENSTYDSGYEYRTVRIGCVKFIVGGKASGIGGVNEGGKEKSQIFYSSRAYAYIISDYNQALLCIGLNPSLEPSVYNFAAANQLINSKKNNL